MSQFAGRAALVTGAGSGIGAACAIALAGHGAMVWCTDLVQDGAAATVRRISDAGGSATALTLDVTDEAAWEAATAAAGPLDILVHAAGVSAGSPITDTAFADWKRVMAVNLDGSFLAMKHGVRALRERGGSITAIASAVRREGGSGCRRVLVEQGGSAHARTRRRQGVPGFGDSGAREYHLASWRADADVEHPAVLPGTVGATRLR